MRINQIKNRNIMIKNPTNWTKLRIVWIIISMQSKTIQNNNYKNLISEQSR